MNLKNEHQCDPLSNQTGTEIAVQQYERHGWYWIDYNQKPPQANEIAFCPYCGIKLDH